MKKILILIFLIIISVSIYFYIKPTNNQKETKKEEKETIVENDQVKNSIFKKYSKQASELVNNMTLEEKVGQLFLVRYDKSIVSTYKDKYPGGYVLFAKDFENHTKETIKNEIDHDQEINKYKLIMAVDEEGGYVTRISRFKAFRNERFSSPRYYYETGGYELLEQTENEKATLLKEIGINLNLAPVADISTDENDFINNRAFGKGTEETSEFIKNMVKYANNNSISSCLKHFPGYGNNVDTHTGIAIDNRSYENFLENDFKPFEAGIKENVPSILVSHNIVNALDTLPSSLSKKVIDELRNTLNYTGIVITDDLAMDAVKEYVEDNKAATLAINAGNDLIITSDFETMYDEVLNSVKENTISLDTINTAVTRIIAWKYQMELL